MHRRVHGGHKREEANQHGGRGGELENKRQRKIARGDAIVHDVIIIEVTVFEEKTKQYVVC